MIHPEILETIDGIVDRWPLTDAAKRVDAAESMAMVHGLPDYVGVSIPEYLQASLLELASFMVANQQLVLESVLEETVDPSATLQKFLDAEEAKINRADELSEKLLGYKFGWLDPRYHATKRELDAVIKSFTIVDENYQLNLPKL